jgi:hypothetical protein
MTPITNKPAIRYPILIYMMDSITENTSHITKGEPALAAHPAFDLS